MLNMTFSYTFAFYRQVIVCNILAYKKQQDEINFVINSQKNLDKILGQVYTILYRKLEELLQIV